MSIFDIERSKRRLDCTRQPEPEDTPPIIPPDEILPEAAMIAFKIYDICRAQKCLEPHDIGPARYAGGDLAGEPIIPPPEAVGVRVERLAVRRTEVASKTAVPFKPGFWTIVIDYTFEYELSFRYAGDREADTVKAKNCFRDEVVLFGSEKRANVAEASDFLGGRSACGAEPFAAVEANAIPLLAALHPKHRPDGENAQKPRLVFVTIGLFAIAKLFRIIDLTVVSRGFSLPETYEKTLEY